MNLTRRYSLLAYSLLKRKLSKLTKPFAHLKPILEAAYFPTSLDEYVASLILTLIIIAPSSFLVGMAIGASVGYDVIGVLLTGILTMVVSISLVLAFFLLYPVYSLRAIRSNIDKFIPYASAHMATIAGTGVSPQVIFHILGNLDEYGMVARICKRIDRNISIFGYDILSAISEEAKRVPSYKFKDLLWSISSTIRTGGNLRSVLMEKSKALMDEQRRAEAKYIEFLSMMAEVYATLFVAGTTIIFVMATILGGIGGFSFPVKGILQIFTYLIIPLASVAFIIIIDSTKPAGV